MTRGVEKPERIYEPFGSDTEQGTPGGGGFGFIGERKDAVAGLHYLNARYYDPELAMFIQPDWFEVTDAGVGTNRYAYSGNDPVNLRDTEGNRFEGLGPPDDGNFPEAARDSYNSAYGRASREGRFSDGGVVIDAAEGVVDFVEGFVDTIEGLAHCPGNCSKGTEIMAEVLTDPKALATVTK